MSIDYTKNNDWFKIDGVSSKDKGIWLDTPPVPPMAKQRYTSFQTSTDEDRSTPDDSFEDVKYKLVFYTFDNSDYDNREIYSFIQGAKQLEISKLDGLYFKVRQVELSSADASYQGKKIKYTATFTLAPFKYAVSNDPVEIESGDYISNEGSRYAKPLIELSGAGTIQLVFNNIPYTVTLPSTGEVVYIDSDRYITYDKTTHEVLHNAVSGQYPMLGTGENVVSFVLSDGASIDYVKLTKNERWY